MDKYKVFILGGDHYNTYGVVRSLGEKGIISNVAIIGTHSNDSFVLKSKYIEMGDAFIEKDESINFLISNASKFCKNILICCCDDAEELVMDHYKELRELFVLPICDSIESQKAFMNKSVITKLAEGHGLTTPNTWKAVNRQIPDVITYPCITKPETSTSGRKSDIVKCRNREELENVIYDQHRCSDFTIQQFIEFEKEISILGTVLYDGTIVFSGCIEKIRTCMIGTSSFARMVDNSIIGDNKEKLVKLLKSTTYRGLFSAEFLLKDGILYFLEVNFRNDGNTYVATASGLNLPYLYVQSWLSQDKFEIPVPKFPCYFMLDIEDFISNVLSGRTNYVEWIRNLHQVDCCLVYNKKDKRPFQKKLIYIIISLIKRKSKFKL